MSDDKPMQNDAPAPPPTHEQREADLALRIDHLGKDAAAIVTARGSAAGHYEQHREAFNAKQGELAEAIKTAPQAEKPAMQNEKLAQGHDFAAFLAGRVGEYKAEVGQKDTAALLANEAATHREIAGELRGEQRGMTTEEMQPPTHGKYDALRATEAAPAKPELLDVPQQLGRGTEQAQPMEEGPTRPQHLHHVVGSRPTPSGTETTRGSFYTAQDNPAATPSDREKFSAGLKAIAESSHPMKPNAATQQQQEESTKRQDGERRSAAGEAPADPATASSRPKTEGEKLTAALKQLGGEVTKPGGNDGGHTPRPPSRGMF